MNPAIRRRSTETTVTVRIARGMCVLLMFSAHVFAQSAEPCGSLANAVGPFDYRTASQKTRDLVERYHFRDDVRVRDTRDVVYTLKAFPNHPRALMAIAEIALRENRPKPRNSPYTVDCWFERATRFRSDDAIVKLIHGIALLKAGQVAESIERLEAAAKAVPEHRDIHYHLGLAYFEAKDYEKSLEHAAIAYERGASLPGLRNKLQSVKMWR